MDELSEKARSRVRESQKAIRKEDQKESGIKIRKMNQE
jgi:hypothetical protein